MTALRSDRRDQRRLDAEARLAVGKPRLCGHVHVTGGADRCPALKVTSVKDYSISAAVAR